MTDQRFTDLLSKQLAGEISPEEVVELNALLLKSDAYKSEYENLTAYFEERMPSNNNIDEVFQKIKQKINVSETELKEPVIIRSVKKNTFTWRNIAAVLALCICSLGTYYFVVSENFSNANKENNYAPWKTSQTFAGKKTKFTLSDGTLVTLNAQSHLKYPISFNNGKNREVYLEGEAFFDVKKSTEQPFIIHTKQMKVMVLGTAFDVKAYENDPFIETTLLRGSVQITLNKNPAGKIILKPGEKFTLPDKNEIDYSIAPYTLYKANNNSNDNITEISWLDNRLSFKNQKFGIIANDIERRYDVKIKFKSNRIKDFSFTGKYEKETVEELLNSLKYVENFSYKKEGKIIYIY